MAKKPKTLSERLLTIFGDIKVFKWPMFLLYHPSSFKVKGDETREVMETLQPGDILVRGYRDYLDGYFIPGFFSHVGLYLGEVTQEDRAHVTSLADKMSKETVFRTGKQMVVHALAEGVLLEDVINFCRCDFMAVLRFPAMVQKLQGAPPSVFPDRVFSEPERKIHEALLAGEAVPFREMFPIVKAAALGRLGTDYDFAFDFDRFNRLSCSELVYFATKCATAFLNIHAENRRILFLRRSMITPDAFVRAGLELVWKSRSIDQGKLENLRTVAPAVRVVAPISAGAGRLGGRG